MLSPEILKSIESANLIKNETDDLQKKISLVMRVLPKIKLGLEKIRTLSTDLINDEERKPGALFPHGIDSGIRNLTDAMNYLDPLVKDINSANTRVSLWFRDVEKNKKRATKVYRKLYDGDGGEPF
jgi:hypothetical protein